MYLRSIVFAFMAALIAGMAAGVENGALPADSATPPAAGAEKSFDAAKWKPQLDQVRQQFDLLKMFGAATQFGGLKVKIPGDLQRIPLQELAKIEAATKPSEEKTTLQKLAELEKHGIEIYLKELTFQDADFQYDNEPQWVESHPAIASMLGFTKLGVAVEAKTKIGRFPVGCEFLNGKLPFDFDLTDKGYAVNVIPERRTADAQLDNVMIDLGGPLSKGALSKFFGKEIAKVVLKVAAGQTLKMDKGGLLGGEGGSMGGVEKLVEGLIK